MMVGRKAVLSRNALEVKWDLIELPSLDSAVYRRGWFLDNDEYIVGVNTYINDDTPEVDMKFLTLGGKYVTINDKRIYIEPFDPLSVDGKYIKLNDQFLFFGEVV